MEGYLTKVGGKWKSWKRRWFSVSKDGNVLVYSETPESKESKGEISISDIFLVKPADSCGSSVKWPLPPSEHSRCFGIATHERLYAAYADSANEALAWRTHLNCLVVAHHNRTDDEVMLAAAELRALLGASAEARTIIEAHEAAAALMRAAPSAALAATSVLTARAVELLEALSVLEFEDEATGPKAGPVDRTVATAADTLLSAGAASAGDSSAITTTATTNTTTSHGATPLSSEAEDAKNTNSDFIKSRIASVWENMEAQAAASVQASSAQMLCDDKRSQWVTARIFVSSTFADFFSEREALAQRVFPRLREWAQERKVHVIDCDLRWGVPADSSTAEVISTCLGEIERCRQTNGNTFLITLLGARYGWVPDDVPSYVSNEYNWVPGASITHMEVQRAAYCDGNPAAMFFLRDPDMYDAIPSEFERDFVPGNAYNAAAQTQLRQHLRDKFPPERVVDYAPSVGEVKTVSHGVQKVELTDLDAFVERAYEFLCSAIAARYPMPPKASSICEQLRQPHTEYRQQRTDMLVGRTEEVEAILKWLHAPLVPEPDECEKVRKKVEAEAAEAAREAGEEEVNSSAATEAATAAAVLALKVKSPPLQVLGKPGSGRGMVLAAVAAAAEAAGVRVFYHSAAATPEAGMAELRARIVLELGEGADAQRMEKFMNNDPDATINYTNFLKMANDALDYAGTARPIENQRQEELQQQQQQQQQQQMTLLVLDGLYKLPLDDVRALTVACSGRLRVLIASDDFNNSARVRSLRNTIDQAWYRSEGHYADKIHIRGVGYGDKGSGHMVLTPLPRIDRVGLAEKYLRNYNKRLSPEQMQAIVDHKGADSPLWIVTALEELRSFGVYTAVTEHIRGMHADVGGVRALQLLRDAVAGMEPTLEGMYTQVLARLKDEGGETYADVCTILSYLVLDRAGMSEQALREAAGEWSGDGDEGNMVPLSATRWTGVLRRLQSLLSDISGLLVLASDDAYTVAVRHLLEDDTAILGAFETPAKLSPARVRMIKYQRRCYKRKLDNHMRGDLMIIGTRLACHLLGLNDVKLACDTLAAMPDLPSVIEYGLRRPFMQFLRCKQSVKLKGPPVPYRAFACRPCSMKISQGRTMAQSCALCGSFVSPLSKDPGHIPYFCLVHSRPYGPVVAGHPIKCLKCATRMPERAMVPLKLCQSCKSPFGWDKQGMASCFAYAS